jgi:SpoVK/Ycf46/Vps4 family AAA+-type ATPase
MRSQKNLKSISLSNHLVFTGNPGTGKTTIARILANIYFNIGLVSKGQLIEVDRAGLVAGYLGQTALKTEEVIQKAKGGILFIDEAYSLANDDFGKEAIETLLKRMEDFRDDLVVIVAGYPIEMQKFIHSNPGLESRFNKQFHFEDYNTTELEHIFLSICESQNYKMNESAHLKIKEIITEIYMNRDERFANGRTIRNLFERIVTNQADRLLSVGNVLTDEALSLITSEDVTPLL